MAFFFLVESKSHKENWFIPLRTKAGKLTMDDPEKLESDDISLLPSIFT